jgi:hypothetical protein
MSQGFVFGVPQFRNPLSSADVRRNLDAIGTLNSGDTPPNNPDIGMPWLNTSEAPSRFTLNFWSGTSWQTIAEFPFSSAALNLVRFSVTPASQTWTLVHNLGRPSVSVTLFDVGGRGIQALNVDISNINQAVVQHAAPLEGAAIVIG